MRQYKSENQIITMNSRNTRSDSETTSDNSSYSYYRIVPWVKESVIKDSNLDAYWPSFTKNPSPGAENIVLRHVNTAIAERVWFEMARLSPHKDVLESLTTSIRAILGPQHAHRGDMHMNIITTFLKCLCINKSGAAVDVIANNLDQIAECEDEGILWSHLATNPFAGELFKFATESKIALDIQLYGSSSMLNNMSLNTCPEAVEIMLANEDYIYWPDASGNSDPRITELFIARARACNNTFINTPGYMYDSVWEYFNQNTCPLAVEYLAAHPDKIIWKILSKNYSREAVALLAANPHNIHWLEFSANPLPEAVALMKLQPDKINWAEFSANPLPEAVAFMKLHPDKIDFGRLSANTNPDAFAMLEHAPVDKINLDKLFENPAIFEQTYKYSEIRENMDIHREELARVAGHPRRLARHLDAGGDPDDF